MKVRPCRAMVVFALSVLACLPCFAATSIDPEKSVMTLTVRKTGLFSAFGHEHEINAPIKRGTFSEADLSVELEVDSRQLKVTDQDVTDKDRQEIQKTMLGPEVLDSDKFPDIRFHSTAVQQKGEGHWLIKGDLSLHGQTQSISLEAWKVDTHYRGSVEIRQKDFGITPVTVAGGAVKVKNEVKVEFDIVGK